MVGHDIKLKLKQQKIILSSLRHEKNEKLNGWPVYIIEL